MLPAFALLLAASCVNDDAGGTPTGTAIVHGTILVSLYEAFPPYWERHATTTGQLVDGPSPQPFDWVEQAASGSCRVIRPEVPFCEEACGSGAMCSLGGVCVAFPEPLDVGPISVEGIRTTSGKSSFVMRPSLGVYRPSGDQPAYPPYDEGALVTVTAKGSAAAAGFTLGARGPAIPELLNDSIVLDGSPIVVRWTPPGPDAGPTTMLVAIDVSHHGGLKGAIHCETGDDGEVEIAGSLVNELKALGVSGFPQIDLVRRTSAALEGHAANLILEARVLDYVTIPGLSSCREDGDCPGGQTCQDDFKCQ